jgi:hypothetical protein
VFLLFPSIAVLAQRICQRFPAHKSTFVKFNGQGKMMFHEGLLQNKSGLFNAIWSDSIWRYFQIFRAGPARPALRAAD